MHISLYVKICKEKAKAYLRAKKSFVFNATNITIDMRSRWISLFTQYKARVKLIYIEVPYVQLMAQNKARAHAVPEKVIHNMIGKLEMPSPGEAHDVIYEVEKWLNKSQ